MPNISVSDQQSLANELSTRLQGLNASTPNADLVYLARMIEIFNGNANLSAVSAEGTTQIAAVIAQGIQRSANYRQKVQHKSMLCKQHRQPSRRL